MILYSNNIENYGREVSCLIAMTHLSLPKIPYLNNHRLTVIWNGHAIADVAAAMAGLKALRWDDPAFAAFLARRDLDNALELTFNNLFPNLERRYYTHRNALPDYNMLDALTNLITITGREKDHKAIFNAFTDLVCEVPSGDDSSFDDWPSLYGAYLQYACDLATAFNTEWYLDEVRNTYDEVEDAWVGRGTDSDDLVTYREELWRDEVAVHRP